MAIGNQPPPTKRRIEEEKEEEIKGNIHLGITEVIDNPSRTKALFIDLIKSAKSEILLILPTVNAFLREYRIGALQLFREISTGVGTVYPEDSGVYEDEGKREEIGNTKKKKKISIRILTPTCDMANTIIDELITRTDGSNNGIQIRYVQPKYHITTATIMIIDRKISLVLEKIDDAKEEFNEAVGLSTYSTSRPTVASYVSIFENFWDQIELYEEHKAKDRLEREFINLVAHELRTPTQAVLGYMELALMETDNDITHTGNVGQYIAATFRNALRLQRLTKDILDIARIESNTLKLSKVRLDLVEKINDTIGDVRHAQVADRTTIPTKNNTTTKIEFIKPDRPILINADGLRIQEVITNLLSNAVNATRNNNSTSSIRVYIQVVEGSKSTDTENGNSTCVIIRIKDNGKGIDPEIMPRLFTKFVTKFESGLGLGLYISKSIIKAHGGKIWAENNKDGNGATFNFSLPLSNN